MTRILIVDDSRVILSVVQTYLVGLDAEIELATSAEQALALFQDHGAELVISDIRMPGMDGVQLAKRLKAAVPEVKVILISSAKKPEGADAFRRGAVDAFVPKPIDGDLLRQRVERLLAPPSETRRETPPVSRRLEPPLSPRAQALRVLVADDTEVGRRILERILRADSAFELVALARDARDAIDATIELRPDLVLLDATLPRIEGRTAVQRIMQQSPTRVIVVTERDDPSSATAAFEAMRAGALELLQRPSWGDPSGPAASSFRERLRELAEVPVVGQRRAETPARPRMRERHPRVELVAIVASTGGPSVLASLLPAAAAAIDSVPVLIVQHLLTGFDGPMTDWLADVTKRPVRLACDGDAVAPGVLFAPDGRHMQVASRDRISVSERPIDARHRPSGDLLFESAARAFGASLLAVILTGMGDDGVVGARLVRARGGLVLAQDPETCAVPGMPGAGIAESVVDLVLTPAEIAQELVARVRVGGCA